MKVYTRKYELKEAIEQTYAKFIAELDDILEEMKVLRSEFLYPDKGMKPISINITYEF